MQITQEQIKQTREAISGQERVHDGGGEPQLDQGPENAPNEVVDNQPDPNQEPEAPKEPKESDWEAKLAKVQEATQKRIDKLVAKNKQLEAQVMSKNESSDPDKEHDDYVMDIKQEFDTYNAQWDKLEQEKFNAREEGDSKRVSEINREMKKIDIKLKRLDDEFMKLEDQRESKKEQANSQKNLSQFSNSFASMMEQFPELDNGNDGINTDSDLYKQAIKLMETGARKPKWATFAQAINPAYDHPHGPKLAVLEAASLLAKQEVKKAKETVKKSNTSDDYRNQPLTGGNGQHISKRGLQSDRTIDQLISNIDGRNRHEKMRSAAEALKAIKEKQGLRTFH